MDASQQTAVDATLATIGWNTTKGGAATTGVSALFSSEVGVAIGILIGVIGLAVQWWYRRKQDKREQAEHELKMLLRKDHL